MANVRFFFSLSVRWGNGVTSGVDFHVGWMNWQHFRGTPPWSTQHCLCVVSEARSADIRKQDEQWMRHRGRWCGKQHRIHLEYEVRPALLPILKPQRQMEPPYPTWGTVSEQTAKGSVLSASVALSVQTTSFCFLVENWHSLLVSPNTKISKAWFDLHIVQYLTSKFNTKKFNFNRTLSIFFKRKIEFSEKTQAPWLNSKSYYLLRERTVFPLGGNVAKFIPWSRRLDKGAGQHAQC